MNAANAIRASDAVGVRLRFVIQFMGSQMPEDGAPAVTSLVRHPVTKLGEATRVEEVEVAAGGIHTDS